jgi:phage regulator Rha-like protein
MSKFTRSARKPTLSEKNRDKAVTNFMAGTSYKINPLDTLRIVATSSIFGEPQYYRSGGSGSEVRKERRPSYLSEITKYCIFSPTYIDPKDTSADLMTKAIDDALDYDFEGVLKFAVELRHDFYMRLNPAVILVRAAMHPGRKDYTDATNGAFSSFVGRVARRPDDLTSMVEYYISTTGDKNKMPAVLKRAIAKRLVGYDEYQISKYQNKGMGLIDLVRIVHARGDDNKTLNKLIKDGSVPMPEDKETWRHMRSEGMEWREIMEDHADQLTHFDIVNQLRSMFSTVDSSKLAKKITKQMLAGVLRGKLFPYRYWVAHNVLSKASDVHNKGVLLDALEEAIDIAVANLPRLSGTTMVLSDNSGSAWGAFNFQGASTRVAEIGNLSAVITGMASDEGYIGLFGDTLEVIPVSKRNGALTQAQRLNDRGHCIPGGTENGIWIFFDRAIRNKEHWDNIFVYSDMQAGHGGLYGINGEEYSDYIWKDGRRYGNAHIDVLRLLEEYKKRVNPSVNFFSVQTAGYNNMVIPEHIHRGAILAGWTGKEAIFADALIKQWDQIENPVQEKPQTRVRKTTARKTSSKKAAQKAYKKPAKKVARKKAAKKATRKAAKKVTRRRSARA